MSGVRAPQTTDAAATSVDDPDAPAVPIATVLGYSCANFGVNMVSALTNSAMPLFLGSYGLPNLVIGFLAQERSFVGGFVQPVVGALSDRTATRFGRRKPFFLVGVPLTIAALALLASHPPLWAVLALLVVFSFFLAIANDPYMALMADITPERQRGRVGSVMAVFNMLGQVALLYIASQYWASNEGLVFGAVGLGLAVSFAITFATVQEPPLPPPQPKAVKLAPRAYLQEVLRHRELAKYCGAQFFFWLGSGAAVPFLTRFGIEVLGTDEATAFQLMMVAVGSTALAALPAGVLGDRFGKKQVLSAGLTLFAAVALVGSQTQTVEQGVVVMALVGTANAVIASLAFPLLTDLMPSDRKGEFTGLGSLVWSLAQPIGSTLAGLTVDLTGSFRTVFLVAGLAIALSVLGLQTVHPPARLPSDRG